MHRAANDFAECVKRMSGKSPCGEAMPVIANGSEIKVLKA